MSYYNAPPYYGVAFEFEYGLTSTADTTIFKIGPALEVGDVMVSQEGGAFVNITDLPVEIGATGVLTFTLTAAEMTAERVTVRCHDVGGGQWLDALIVLFTQEQFGGPSSVFYTVTVGGLPLAGVYCRMTTDAAGLINVDAGTTDVLGQVRLDHNLLSGTSVYIWRSLAGYEFEDPDLEVIP